MPSAFRTVHSPPPIGNTEAKQSDEGQSIALSTAFRRYLCWLVQLQASAESACDDAYTLDRLLVQGVLPLRQRTAPSATITTGLKAAVYELAIGASERERADVLQARQLHRTWKLTGSAHGRGAERKAATFSHFPPSLLAPSASDASTPTVTHSTTPLCPCRVFLTQQQQQQQQHETDEEQGSYSSGHSISGDGRESADVADTKDTMFGVHLRKDRVESGGRSHRHIDQVNDAAPSTGISGSAGSPPLHLHEVASFPARLKDAVRTGSGAAAAKAPSANSARTARTPSSVSGTSSPLERDDSALGRLNTSSHGARRSQPVTLQQQQQQLLLPITAASLPVRLLSASTATEDEDEEAEEGAGTEHSTGNAMNINRDDGREVFRKVANATWASNKTSGEAVGPIPVDSTSLPSRALHPIWSHIVPEDVRRCSLCSGQLLLNGIWHALYLLQLLTMVSAAPAMAAPLPLPPPTVMKVQPVEALLLLFQTAQRCLIAGVTMAAAVSVPMRPATLNVQTSSRGMPNDALSEGAPLLAATSSTLDVLRGGCGDTTARQAAHAGLRMSSTFAGSGEHHHSGAASTLEKENHLLSALAARTLCVVDALGGVAAAQLWPLKAASSDSSSLAGSVDSTAQSFSFVKLHGDVLSMRFRLFHGAFSVLMVHGGTERGTEALVGVSKEIVQLVSSLQGGAQGGYAAWQHVPADSAARTVSSTVYAEITLALTRLTDTRAGPELKRAAGSGADVSVSDALAVLYDDVRTLCCVVALLAVFADLVRAQEPKSAFSLPNEATAAGVFKLSDVATHLVDEVVYPTLLELQNSSRGSCSAQAHLLLALWWLIRTETVRQWVHTVSTTGSIATLRVLDSEISAVEVGKEGPLVSNSIHWSAWLKDASRAAVRASNASSEFLGLTFRATSPIGSPSPLQSPAEKASLRLWLPASTSTQGFCVASLPLAWVRMWLLLCPPLFQISPTDVLALRHIIEQEEQHCRGQRVIRDAAQFHERKGEEGLPASAPAKSSSDGGEKGARHGSTTSPPRRELRGGQSTTEASRPATDRVAEALGTRSPRRTGAASLSKPDKTKAGKAASTALKRGSTIPEPRLRNRSNDKSIGRRQPSTPSSLIHAEGHLRDAEALQQRLQFSTEPVYFWSRWCQLFLLEQQPPHLARKEDDEGITCSAERVVGVPSSVAMAVSAATAILRNPALAWASLDAHTGTQSLAPVPALRSTLLIANLQSAFPLLSASDLATALGAQSHLFVLSEVSSTAALAQPPRVDSAAPLFASFSFASRLSPLRTAVSTFYHNLTVATSTAALASQDTPNGKTKAAGDAVRLPPTPAPSPSPPRQPSSTHTADGAVGCGQPAKPRNSIAARQSTRAGAVVKRPPLMAARTLPRRTAEESGAPPSPPPRAISPSPMAAAALAAADAPAADPSAMPLKAL